MLNRLGYVPALDGLRGAAVLAVVAAHAWGDRLGGGGVIGVAVFFVLSGYLITSVIVDEWQVRGSFSFGAFFARRALRLLPALLLAVAVFAIVAWLLLDGGARREALFSALFSATYLSGYASFAGYPVVDELAPTWSLAVEEQFYLVWPVLLWLGLRRGWSFGRLAGLTVGLVVASAAVRAATWEAWGRDIYWLPTTWTDALLVGCALALAARAGWSVTWGPRLQGAVAWVAVIFLAALCAWQAITHSAWSYRVVLLLVAVAAGVLIVGLTGARVPWVLRPLELGWMRWVGRRSYAIYLWNAILITGIPAGWEPRRVWLAVGAVLAFPVAELSWRLVESRALAYKRRFERTRAGVERATAEARSGQADTHGNPTRRRVEAGDGDRGPVGVHGDA